MAFCEDILEAEPSGICKSRQRHVEVAIVMVYERGGDKLSRIWYHTGYIGEQEVWFPVWS